MLQKYAYLSDDSTNFGFLEHVLRIFKWVWWHI